jgi:peptide/nickel transport system substrate-binding protein
MNRRSLLLGAAASVAAPLARPALAGTAKTLTFIPQATLSSIDPVWNAAMVTRNLGLMVYESLYGRDAALNPHPQMVAADQVEDAGHRWTMRLRDNLWWHDGTPVLARDCIASLRRWMKRDPAGATLETRIDALEAPDDRTIVFRLNQPFPHLRTLLSRFNTAPIMVPERLAQTDPFKSLPEAIGCGPFRWLADEQVIGSHAAFARFEKYVPRDEPASFTAGGKRVMVDRVEWHMIPDASTAANALATGEVDWLEIPQSDLLPLLRRTSGVTVGRLDEYGQMVSARLNHLAAPTSNVGVRRAMMAAIDQREVMEAVLGDPANWFAPVGFLVTGNPAVDDIGLDALRRKPDVAAVKAMLERAGYHGERLVMLHATDHNIYNPAGTVVADALRAVGMTVDDQAMDWGTVMQRRITKAPVDQGGWSLFPTAAPAAEYRDPMLATFIRASGPKAFYGWPTDARIEQLYLDWLATDDAAGQLRIEQEWEQRAFDDAIHLPLGRFVLPSAWRSNVSGLLKGPAVVFWGVEKA